MSWKYLTCQFDREKIDCSFGGGGNVSVVVLMITMNIIKKKKIVLHRPNTMWRNTTDETKVSKWNDDYDETRITKPDPNSLKNLYTNFTHLY